MKKKIWIAIILLVVIGSITGVLVYLNAEKPLEQDRALYSYEDKSVEEIRILSGNGEVSFTKKQNQWAMVKPKPYKIDQNAVYRLENRLKDFLASRIMEENKDDLQRYGLDKPQGTIYFRLNDGTENTLLIGDITASRVQYYAKDTARKQIYILGSYDVENFLCPVNEFRDRTILSVDTGSTNTISMDVEGTRNFKLVRNADKWSITEPFKGEARGDAVDEMLGDILQMKIKDFIAVSAGSLDRYGLDVPIYTMEIGDEKQNIQKISFGKTDEVKQVIYIRTDNSDEVYTLSLEAFDPQRFKISNFLNEAPLSVAMGDVKKVKIIGNGSVTEFIRDTTKGEDVYTFSGKTVDQQKFTTLYVNIMALAAEGYDPANKGGVPALTVLLELNDSDKKIKMEFVKRDDLTYFIVLDGAPKPFYIGERKVELITLWKDRVLEGI